MKKQKTLFLILYLMVTCFSSMNSATTEHYTLKNGMKIILINDPIATITSVKAYVRVGSIYEENYFGSGISHYLEHLVAGGTTSEHSEKEYENIISMLGGVSNAYTTTDHTSYFINTSPIHTNTAIKTIYEWLFKCSLKDKEVNREKEVITREIEKNNADPNRSFYYLSQQNMYKNHPTKFPIIGYLDNFNKITKEDLEIFYKTHYVPENMVLVIGGPINIDKTKNIIRNTFEKEERRAAPIHFNVNEPIPFNQRYEIENLNISTPRISIRFKTANLYSNDLYALDLLDYILGNGQQSILYTNIVDRQKLAYSIQTASYTPPYTEGYFEVSFECDESNIEKTKQEIIKILNQAKTTLYTKELIEKAKKQKLAENILNIDSVEDKVTKAGLSMLYSYNTSFFDNYSQNFKDISPNEIQLVAKKYFDMDKTVTTIIVPQQKNKVLTANESINHTEPKKIILDNGIKVILYPSKDIPKVSAQVMVLGGLLTETKETNGISYLTAKLLGKGTETYTKQEIQELIEKNGAEMYGNAGNHTLYYSLNCLSEDFNTLFPLYMNTFFNATFPEEELSKEKVKLIKSIKQRHDTWYSQASYTFKKSFFNTNHPYSFSILGEENSINNITSEKINTNFKALLNPEHIIISVFGDFNEKTIEKDIMQYLPPLEKKEAITKTYAHTKHTKANKKQVTFEHDVTSIFIGFDGISYNNPEDYYKLDLVDAVLSGMSYPGGRLHKKLRGKGFVYLVHGINFVGLEPGYFYIYALTNEKSIKDVEALILNEIETLKKKPISSKEFNEAIERMRFYYKDQLSSNQSFMLLTATDELYKNKFDNYKYIDAKIDKLNIKDVELTTKKYLNNPQIIIFQKEKK